MADKPILHVEDEGELAELIAEALSEAGYEVRTARTGASALAMLNQETFALVCLDLGLPAMSGRGDSAADRDLMLTCAKALNMAGEWRLRAAARVLDRLPMQARAGVAS